MATMNAEVLKSAIARLDSDRDPDDDIHEMGAMESLAAVLFSEMCSAHGYNPGFSDQEEATWLKADLVRHLKARSLTFAEVSRLRKAIASL